MKRTLGFAVVALVAAGCSSGQPPADGYSANDTSTAQTAPAQSGFMGPTGYTGRAGPAGPQGPAGLMGAPGSVAIYNFDNGRSDIEASNANTASEIATYRGQNPSLRIALDGSRDLGANDARSQRLSDRRVANVRAALIKAGVPAYKIQSGAFADPQMRQERQVAVLLSTGA